MISFHRIAYFTPLLVLLLALSGCVTDTTSYRTYEIEIDSDPSGAQVATSAEGHQVLGATPTRVIGEYELRTFEKTDQWWVPIVAGALLGIGGTGMIVASSGPERGDISVGLLVPGIFAVMIGLGLPGLSLGAYMQDGNQRVRLPGERKWQRVGRHLPEDELVRALPRIDLTLTRQGFLDRQIQARPGDRLTLEFAIDPDAPAFADASPPRRPEPAASQQAPPQAAPQVDLPSFVSASPQASAYALVIGIENYRSLPDPLGARNDAEAFTKMLRETLGVPARNVRLLTDEGATRSDILSELTRLTETVPAGSRIYFFFSGHGSPDVESGRSFLLPFEGSPETLSHSSIALDEIIAALEDTSARDVIAFVDACFSGMGDRSVIPEGLRPLVPVQTVETSSKVALFSSSGASEVSGALPGQPIGLFTYHLLHALGSGRADINGDGQISLAELETYVSPRVSRDAQEASRNQNPTLDVGDDLGDPAHAIISWGVTRP